MKITVTFVGILGELINEKPFEAHLPQEATYGDLLREIWRQLSHCIPDHLWDGQINAFKDPIMALGRERYLNSPETLLMDGEEVKFLILVAGG